MILDNRTLRSTILLTGHGLFFSHLFANVFDLNVLDTTARIATSDLRGIFVVAVYGTLCGFGMFAAYRSLEKTEDEKAHRFWLRRSLHMMYGLLISLIAVNWFYGWRYVADLGLMRALFP